MKKAIKQEFYRLLHSKTFYVAIGIGMFFSIWLLIDQLSAERLFFERMKEFGLGFDKVGLYYPSNVFNKFIGLDYANKQQQTLYMLFPLLASIPYAASYCTDKNSGYIKNLFVRENKKYYYIAKYLMVFLSGFVVVFFVLIFSLILTMMFFPLLPIEIITAQYGVVFSDQMFFELFQNAPMVYTLFYILIDSVFFGLIAVLTLTLSRKTNLGFVSVVGGTIVYYFASFITSSLQLNQYNPAIFLVPYQPVGGIKLWVIAVEAIIIFAICAFLFLKKEVKKDVF